MSDYTPYILRPKLTPVSGDAPTYSVGMAETFSWVPVENNEGRPLYAQATYLTNAEDLKITLSASNINLDLDNIELNTDELEDIGRITNTKLIEVAENVATNTSTITTASNLIVGYCRWFRNPNRSN